MTVSAGNGLLHRLGVRQPVSVKKKNELRKMRQFAIIKAGGEVIKMEKTINIAVCDDNDEDRERIQQYTADYLDENNLYVRLYEFASAEEFLQSNMELYDLVFFDIYMNEINGMEAAKRLIAVNQRTQVVFISTSIEFAAEAFSIEALHYIVKPIDRNQLYSVLDKFFDSFYTVRTIDVKVGRMTESVFLSDILYIEAKGKKTLIHLKKGELETSQSLSEMANIVPKDAFCMPIRWAIVSLHEIIAVPAATIQLSDGTEIPVSRGKREEVKKAFSDFKWADMRRRMRMRLN